jgi:CRP-like cAMP-binding protein
MDMIPERPMSAGDIIIEQGEPAMEAYLILSGTCSVTLNKGGKTLTLATLGEGEIFGETAFFKGSDAGATVTAQTDGMLQPITPDILDERIARCDPLIRAVFRMLMVRLRKSNEALLQSRPA